MCIIPEPALGEIVEALLRALVEQASDGNCIGVINNGDRLPVFRRQ